MDNQIDKLNDIAFDEKGLIPAIVQDADSGQVLMLAYMNRQSLEKSLESGETWFFSRSRQQLWHKGESSGNYQQIREIRYDCDQDTLLVQVTPVGPACHTGKRSCFYRKLSGDGIEYSEDGLKDIIGQLFATIEDRRLNPKAGSYTTYLFNEGIDKILKKVGEETAEVIIGAKNQSKEEFLYESADLIYHLLVLTAQMGCSPEDIEKELYSRFK